MSNRPASNTRPEKLQRLIVTSAASGVRLGSSVVPSNSFAERLRAWRDGRYQKEAAALLEVPIRTYQTWEQGACVPTEYVQRFVEGFMRDHPMTPPPPSQ